MQTIEQRVMAGVSAVYLARRFSSRRALKSYVLLASALGVAAFTSLPNVLANFVHIESHGLPAVGTFLLTAVEKTNLGVQVALALGAVAALSLVADLARRPDARFA